MSAPKEVPIFASAQVAYDFSTYDVRRVGLMPFAGNDLDARRGQDLQSGFYSEFVRTTPFELVELDAEDLDEVSESEPYRRGWYQPETIISIARRYNLDAILFGTVVQQQSFPPLRFAVQIDMVAAETGLVIWSSSVHLDAKDEAVREGLKLFYGATDGESDGSWQLALISPDRFARFAAFQIAKLL